MRRARLPLFLPIRRFNGRINETETVPAFIHTIDRRRHFGQAAAADFAVIARCCLRARAVYAARDATLSAMLMLLICAKRCCSCS